MDVKPVHSYVVRSDVVIPVSFFSEREQEQPSPEFQKDLHLEVEDLGVTVSLAVYHHCENK